MAHRHHASGLEVIGDKGYDANALRTLLKRRGAGAVIPTKCWRKVVLTFHPESYKERNVIDHMFCRLNDFRRIAKCHDKLAQRFADVLRVVVALCNWTN